MSPASATAPPFDVAPGSAAGPGDRVPAVPGPRYLVAPTSWPWYSPGRTCSKAAAMAAIRRQQQQQHHERVGGGRQPDRTQLSSATPTSGRPGRTVAYATYSPTVAAPLPIGCRSARCAGSRAPSRRNGLMPSWSSGWAGRSPCGCCGSTRTAVGSSSRGGSPPLASCRFRGSAPEADQSGSFGVAEG